MANMNEEFFWLVESGPVRAVVRAPHYSGACSAAGVSPHNKEVMCTKLSANPDDPIPSGVPGLPYCVVMSDDTAR